MGNSDVIRIEDLLRQIELCTTRSIAAGRDVTAVGGFLAALHPTTDLIWLNFAVPSPDQAEDLRPEDVDGLRRLFHEKGRRLRLEYFEALWPDLGRLLEAKGLVVEGRMPLMICGAGDFKRFAAENVAVCELRAEVDDAEIAEFLKTAKAGFGVDSRVEPHEILEQRQYLETGVYRCAYVQLQGKMVGVGTLAQVNNELAGIATLPEFRRRGVAATVSSHLLEQHFGAGRTYAWLSAGGNVAQAVYEKVGFRTAGVQLNYIEKKL